MGHWGVYKTFLALQKRGSSANREMVKRSIIYVKSVHNSSSEGAFSATILFA